jgi:hypothetical protein
MNLAPKETTEADVLKNTPRRSGEGQRLQDEGDPAILQPEITAVYKPAPTLQLSS